MSTSPHLWTVSGDYHDPHAITPLCSETSSLDSSRPTAGPDEHECDHGCGEIADCLCACCNHENSDRLCESCCRAAGLCDLCDPKVGAA